MSTEILDLNLQTVIPGAATPPLPKTQTLAVATAVASLNKSQADDGSAGKPASKGIEEEIKIPQFSVVADYNELCGEGPIWDVEGNQLYWTDCVGKRFYRYDGLTKKHATVKAGIESSTVSL